MPFGRFPFRAFALAAGLALPWLATDAAAQPRFLVGSEPDFIGHSGTHYILDGGAPAGSPGLLAAARPDPRRETGPALAQRDRPAGLSQPIAELLFPGLDWTFPAGGSARCSGCPAGTGGGALPGGDLVLAALGDGTAAAVDPIPGVPAGGMTTPGSAALPGELPGFIGQPLPPLLMFGPEPGASGGPTAFSAPPPSIVPLPAPAFLLLGALGMLGLLRRR